MFDIRNRTFSCLAFGGLDHLVRNKASVGFQSVRECLCKQVAVPNDVEDTLGVAPADPIQERTYLRRIAPAAR